VACFQSSLLIYKNLKLKGFEDRKQRQKLKNLKYRMFSGKLAGSGIPVSSLTLLASSVT
jgi:hypothetical protein